MTETRKTPTMLLKEALAQAERELAQMKQDIVMMNEIGNAQASYHGMCFQWDSIINEINQATGGRLALKGRSMPYEVTVTLTLNVMIPNVDPETGDDHDDWVRVRITEPIMKRVKGHLPGVAADDISIESRVLYAG